MSDKIINVNKGPITPFKKQQKFENLPFDTDYKG